jgi:hypothetical protein
MVGGGLALAAGVAGLGWSFSTYGAFQRQQPGGADAAHPTVSRATFDTLRWVYPTSWVIAAVSAAAVASGVVWWRFGASLFSATISGSPSGGTLTLGGSF